MTNEITFNSWTHPRTGEIRRYINDWAHLVGLDVDFYNTGNISSAALDGKHLSNRKAAVILGAKIWVDEAGEVHVQGGGEYAELIAERITAALTTETEEEVEEEALASVETVAETTGIAVAHIEAWLAGINLADETDAETYLEMFPQLDPTIIGEWENPPFDEDEAADYNLTDIGAGRRLVTRNTI